MKSKKFLALTAMLLMGATTVGAFAGCGGKEIIDPTYDSSKAALQVGTYEGGVGRAWLDDAARRFEELHKNSTFGGKTGVQVFVDAHKVNYGGENLSNGGMNKDVYFTEGVDYYTFVDRGLVADISDIVTTTSNTYGEEKTIESKLDGGIKSYLTARDGKYYMLPFYDGFYGFIYDVDLFEEEGFYFNDAGKFIDGLGKDADATARAEFEAAKSNGPDGLENTYDDGLPATYEQMIELVEEIDNSYIPFCYAGSTEYVDKAFRAYISDYEGYDGMRLNYTFNGKANLVKSISNGVVTTEEVAITSENGYELQKQAGKYYSLKMEETLFGSTKYIGGSYNTMGHTEAQRKFINSKYSNTGERYAMLAEGVWWENEADSVFKEIETSRGEKKSDRRFSFMPVPKASADLAGAQTMLSLNRSYAFINKDSQNMELAKEFMRFLHTDSEMSKFSAKTSIPRSLNYTVLTEDRANATHFGQSLIDMRSTAKVVYPYSSAKIVLDNPSSFDDFEWFATTKIGKDKYTSPMQKFQDQNSPLTAEQYFNGLYAYQEGAWKTLKK